MANTRSGALQTLEIAQVPAAGSRVSWDTLSGPGTGFEGLTVSPTQATTDRTSGGFTTTRKNFYTVNTGSFSIGGNLKAINWFWGENGKRYMFRWRKQGEGSGKPEAVFTAICSVGWTANDRSDFTFAIDLAIDGAITESVQA